MSFKKPATQRVKIDDVARLAGVSTATVSRVINGTGTVSDSTAEKVYQAIGDLKFVAHGSARGLAGSKTDTIGIVLPGVTTFFFTKLIQGINECIYDRGYSLLMYADPTPASVASGKPLPLGEHNTDGLIVFTDFLDDYSIQYLHERNLPIVMLHRSPPEGLNIPKVMFENRKGAYAIVTHLIEQGSRRIVYLKGPEGNEDSRQRELGYCQALKDAGMEVDDSLIGRGKFAAASSANVIRQMLLDGVEFDAIFAGDDNGAIGAMEVLKERGLRIPEDVALAGFNDDYMSQYITPALTTVRAPIHESGFEAAQKLLDLIDGKQVKMHSQLSTALIVRESTKGGSNG